MPEAQAVFSWTEPTGTLGQLMAAAARRVQSLRADRTRLESAARDVPPRPSLAEALSPSRDVAIVAEVKRRSPSRGNLNETMDAPARARAYVDGGAAAISVLTEPESFGGSLDDLTAVSAAVRVPTLRKDFIIDELQLFEARASGASAALLIARALPPARLAPLVHAARDLDIEPLVEVRDERELERALETGALLIGVNHRDLETLVIDVNLGERLIPAIPRDRIVIAESGVSARRDVERLGGAGADAILVGSTLSASSDPAAAVRALDGVPRASRG